MVVRVRFAPSPTGRLHVGNIYIALHNWLYAGKAGGEFLLRLDDTDRERSTEDFADGIKADLEWLGLAWNLFDRQSRRLAIYDAAAQRLRDAGRLYPCYESAEELGLKRKVQLSQGKPPIYDRAALKLTDADRAKLEAEGKRPHWRFKLEPRDVAWNDLVRGPQHVDESSQSDPVLMREDGTYLYTLCSVADDIDFDITHIIRGADHVTNAATQIQIFEALGGRPPSFAHLPLLVDAVGEGLSKRLGSLSVRQMRDEGLEPMAIAAYLARIGTGDPVAPVRMLADLLPDHDLSKFGKSSPRFDPDELKHLNAKLLHHLPFEEARGHLAALGLGHIDPAVWDVARANVEKVEDVALWQSVVKGPVTPAIADAAFAAKAAELLPLEPWNAETWSAWTNAVKNATGRKGKELFMPLRQALTAADHGPELKLLLPLIGRERALKRLKGETA
ncbi:MAG TPA: glutamate--tRNA ligase [Dongiaceae bacterium]|jgi:glutamyl-tRNA synthetase|nr:glutamate--tRNA ligase [Dongiaceae bacterium]